MRSSATTDAPTSGPLAEAELPSKAALGASRVLVVGDVMLDRYWFGQVDRISPEAPVPVVRVTRLEERLGGAANVAFNVRAVGAAATLLAVAGDDEAAASLDRLLADHGIEATLARDPAHATVVKLRVIGHSQQLLRLDFESAPGGDALRRLADAFESRLGPADVVLFSDYGKGALAHVPRLIERARAAGKPVLVDPKGGDWQRYAGATLITPNLGELAKVVGDWRDEADLRERVDALRARIGVGALLLTRSEAGMTLFDAGAPLHVASRAREVFDVTGAGDTVIALMAALVGAGMPLRDAVPHANRGAGIVVGRFGTAGVGYEELVE